MLNTTDFELEYKRLAEKHMELATHYKDLEAQVGELKDTALRVQEVIGTDKSGRSRRLNILAVRQSPIGVSIGVEI